MSDPSGLLQVQDGPQEQRRAYIPKGERQDWNTPPEILELVRHVFGGPIDLDPCSNPDSVTGAETEVWFQYANVEPRPGRNVIRTSGLILPWRGHAYVNPPFDHIDKWVRKCRGEHEVRGAEVLLLGPAGVSTRWFHAHIPSAAAWMLWRGRFKFLGAEHGCPFNPLFAYWGSHADRFLEAFGPKGMVFFRGGRAA